MAEAAPLRPFGRGEPRAMAIATGRRRAQAGTGSCTKCTCTRFEGQGSICENCKHHYDEHNVAWPRGCDLIWSLADPDPLPVG
jgi:hypothetical protein